MLSTSGSTEILGDFNGDGQWNCDDINLLTSEVVAGTNDAAFDLSGDGQVNLDDRDAWLAEAATENGLSSAYPLGDFNLDGAVNGQDFLIWNANKFTNVDGYCSGDGNMDGVVDGADFIIWNTNKFTSVSIVNNEQPSSSVDSQDVPPMEAVGARSIATPSLPARVDSAFADYREASRRADERPDELFKVDWGVL